MTRTPEQRRQYRQQEKARHRLKWKARQAISQQLRRGTIKRGNCEKCGKPNAQAHHDDYSKSMRYGGYALSIIKNGITSTSPTPSQSTETTMIEPTNSLSRTASWVIRERATKRVICETFEQRTVAALNTAKYEAVPILEYLQSLNA